ncbi:MAG: hypothetical protein HY901_34110 [Deltaproteobacteria bacterium]|nr:hypothetical protein [Deltaproteobacteria bacterium]
MAIKAKKVIKRAARPNSKVRGGGAKAPAPKSPPRLNLANPKDKAVLDVLALAMSADTLVTADETDFAVAQMQRLLGRPELAVANQLRSLVTSSVAAISTKGRDKVLARALREIDSPEERRILFALASSMTCVDGLVEESEGKFLAKLRLELGLSEAQALQAMAGVATVMARQQQPG